MWLNTRVTQLVSSPLSQGLLRHLPLNEVGYNSIILRNAATQTIPVLKRGNRRPNRHRFVVSVFSHNIKKEPIIFFFVVLVTSTF